MPQTAVSAEEITRRIFYSLAPGDRVEVDHEMKVGSQVWRTKTSGTVVETRRRRHGLHFRRNPDDKVFSDEIVLKRESGELTTLAVDEFTKLRKLS